MRVYLREVKDDGWPRYESSMGSIPRNHYSDRVPRAHLQTAQRLVQRKLLRSFSYWKWMTTPCLPQPLMTKDQQQRKTLWRTCSAPSRRSWAKCRTPGSATEKDFFFFLLVKGSILLFSLVSYIYIGFFSWFLFRPFSNNFFQGESSWKISAGIFILFYWLTSPRTENRAIARWPEGSLVDGPLGPPSSDNDDKNKNTWIRMHL